jgi:hypothetical protein
MVQVCFDIHFINCILSAVILILSFTVIQHLLLYKRAGIIHFYSDVFELNITANADFEVANVFFNATL